VNPSSMQAVPIGFADIVETGSRECSSSIQQVAAASDVAFPAKLHVGCLPGQGKLEKPVGSPQGNAVPCKAAPAHMRKLMGSRLQTCKNQADPPGMIRVSLSSEDSDTSADFGSDDGSSTEAVP